MEKVITIRIGAYELIHVNGQIPSTGLIGRTQPNSKLKTQETKIGFKLSHSKARTALDIKSITSSGVVRIYMHCATSFSSESFMYKVQLAVTEMHYDCHAYYSHSVPKASLTEHAPDQRGK